MDYKSIQRNTEDTGEHKRTQGNTREGKRTQENTREYKRIQDNTWGEYGEYETTLGENTGNMRELWGSSKYTIIRDT